MKQQKYLLFTSNISIVIMVQVKTIVITEDLLPNFVVVKLI